MWLSSALPNTAMRGKPGNYSCVWRITDSPRISISPHTGQGEMKAAGQLPGATFADVAMVELREIHAALPLQQIRAFLPLSGWWLEHRLGISEPKELMLLEADQDLPPEVRKMDLLLVDRSAGNKLPRGEGLYVFSVATGLAVKRVEVSIKRDSWSPGRGSRKSWDRRMTVDNCHMRCYIPFDDQELPPQGTARAVHPREERHCSPGVAEEMPKSVDGPAPRHKRPRSYRCWV